MGDHSHDTRRTTRAPNAPSKPSLQEPFGPRFPTPNFLNPVARTPFQQPFAATNFLIGAKASASVGSTGSKTGQATKNSTSHPSRSNTPKNVYGPTLSAPKNVDFFKSPQINQLKNPLDLFNRTYPNETDLFRKQLQPSAAPKIKKDDARKTIATFIQREGSLFEIVLRSKLLNAESQHLEFRKEVNTQIIEASKSTKKLLNSKKPSETRADISKQLEELSKQDASVLNQARAYRDLSAKSAKFVEQMNVPNQGMISLTGYAQCIERANQIVPKEDLQRTNLAKAVALLSVYESIDEKASSNNARSAIDEISKSAKAQNVRIERRLPNNQRRAKDLQEVEGALAEHPELASEFIKSPAAATAQTPTMFRADLMMYIDARQGGLRNGKLTKENFQQYVNQWNSEHIAAPDKQITFSEQEFNAFAGRSGAANTICRVEFEEACGTTLPDLDDKGAYIPGTAQPVRTALGDRNFVNYLRSSYAASSTAPTEGMTSAEIKSFVKKWNTTHLDAQVRYDSECERLFNLWSQTREGTADSSTEVVLYQNSLIRADAEVRARARAAQDPHSFLKRRVNQEMESLRNDIYAIQSGRDASRLENKYDENLAGEAMWAIGHVSNFALNSWDAVSGAERGSWKLDGKMAELQKKLDEAEAAAKIAGESGSSQDLDQLSDSFGSASKTAGKANVMLNDHVHARDMVTRVTRTVIVVTTASAAATVTTPFTAGTSWGVAAPIIASTVTGALVETSLGALEAKAEGHAYTDFRRDLGMGGLSGFGAGVFAPAGKSIDVLANNSAAQVTNLGLKGATARFLPGFTRIAVTSTLNGTTSAGVEGITAATEGDFDHLGERMWAAGKTGAIMTAGVSLASKGFVAAKNSIVEGIENRRIDATLNSQTPLISQPTVPTRSSPQIGPDGTILNSTEKPIIQFNSNSSGYSNTKFSFEAPKPSQTNPLSQNPNFYTGPVNFVAGKDLPQQIDRWLAYSGRGANLHLSDAQVATTTLPPANGTNPVNPPVNSAPLPPATSPAVTTPANATSSAPISIDFDTLRTQLRDPVHGDVALKQLMQSGAKGQKVVAEELLLARKLSNRSSAESKAVWDHFVEGLHENTKLSPELLDVLRSHKWSVTGSLSYPTLKKLNQAIKDSVFIADRSAIPELTKRLSSVRNGDSYRAAAALAELGDEGVKIVLNRIENNGFFSGARGVSSRIDALRGLGKVDMHALSDANQIRLIKAVDQVSKEAVTPFSIRNRFARNDAAAAVVDIFKNAEPAAKKEMVESLARLLKSNSASRDLINQTLVEAAGDSTAMRNAVAKQMVDSLRNRDPNIRKSAYSNLGAIGAEQGLTLDEIAALERRTHAFKWGMPVELRRSGRKLAANSLSDLTIIPKSGATFTTKEVDGLIVKLRDEKFSAAAGKALATQDPKAVMRHLETLLNQKPLGKIIGVKDLRRAQIEACNTIKDLIEQHGTAVVLSTGLKQRLQTFCGLVGRGNEPLKQRAREVLQSARATVATP